MQPDNHVEILVIGAGIAGIATAYYLCKKYGKKSVMLVDCRPPMSYTSAQSGDNYRNWWPHPTMTAFTDYSIDLMEQIAGETSNVFHMTRGGYVLATRRDEIDHLIDELHAGYQGHEPDSIRIHGSETSQRYQHAIASESQGAPSGVDVLANKELIQRSFPSLSTEITHAVHIRRAGDISGQQLGQFMLEQIREAGGRRTNGRVRSMDANGRFNIEIERDGKVESIKADIVVNAAGPFAPEIASMLGIELPMTNVFQQKIAFEDSAGALPRQLPFSIDLDDIELDWNDEERELLAENEETAWLTQTMPGGVHCRPDGGINGSWIKLGWAYNRQAGRPRQERENEALMDPQYPEIVMRAAARLNPSLKTYIDQFPTRYSHYGGYYSMTAENWPLIGPMGVEGAFIVGALSGFGSMSACATGAICSEWISGNALPHYAQDLSLARYDNEKLMTELRGARSRGIL